VGQELLILLEQLNSPLVFSGAGTVNPSGATEFTPGFYIGFVLLNQ
jgi:hypothetical protein